MVLFFSIVDPFMAKKYKHQIAKEDSFFKVVIKYGVVLNQLKRNGIYHRSPMQTVNPNPRVNG